MNDLYNNRPFQVDPRGIALQNLTGTILPEFVAFSGKFGNFYH